MDVRGVTVGIRKGYLAGIIAFNAITLAQAEEVIGVAAVVRNEVDQALPTRVIRINAGENISRDEVVKTGPESGAKLVFSDNTNLSMGPGSTVTLNKFVYSGASRYEKATFELVKGAFRFTTGASDKRAYEIQTPTATIGVRGTVLDIRVDAKVSDTLVVLQEGAASVCTVSVECDRDRPDYDRCERDRRERDRRDRDRRDRDNVANAAGCKQLTEVGQTATATSQSVSISRGAGGSGAAEGAGGWSFSNAVGDDPSLTQAISFQAAMLNGNAPTGTAPGGAAPSGSAPASGGSVFPPGGAFPSPGPPPSKN
jgi:hypothetical protein